MPNSREKEQRIIERLKREVEKENPASISQISKDFGYNSSKTVTRLAKSIFSPEIYENKWGSKKGQKLMPDGIVYQRLIDELKKEKPASLESIGKDLGFVDGGPVRRVAKERISNEIYIQAWGKSDIKASDIEDKIIEKLEKEIEKDRPAPLRSIGLEFGFSNGNPIREIAIGHFSEEVYMEAWGRQVMTEDIEKDIIDTLKEEMEKDSPRPLKDIGYEFGFKSGDPIIRIAQNIFSDEIYMKKWGRPTTSPITIEEIKRCLNKQIDSENPMSLSEISREFNLDDYGVVRRIAKNTLSEQIYQDMWGIEEISDVIKNTIKNDILNGKLSMNQIAQRYNISVSPIRAISLKIELKNQNYIHSGRFPQIISALLGTEIHPIIQKIVTKHFLGFFLKIFSEIVVDKHTGNKVDFLIPNIDREKSLINFFANQSEAINILAELNLNLEQLNKYKALLFDPTMDLSKKSIIGKILKYQHPNMLFFIVDYRRMGIWQTRPIHIFNIPSDSRIKYPQNVKIIDYILFSKLIGLKEKLRQYFFNSIHLVADILILDSEERDFSQELEKVREYNSLIMQERFHNQDFYEYLKLHNSNYKAFFKKIGSIDKFM